MGEGVSVSHNTSYHKISRRLEGPRSLFGVLQSPIARGVSAAPMRIEPCDTKLHRLEASQVMLNLTISHFIGYCNGPWLQYFNRIRNSIKIWTALVQDMRSQSQRKLAHVRTVYQNFVAISWTCYEQEYYKLLLNIIFDRNIVNRMGGRPCLLSIYCQGHRQWDN